MTAIFKTLALTIALCMASIAQARFFLKVELVYKKGIDQSLTLSNELHSIETFRNGQELELSMKNGVRALLEPTFLPVATDSVGPSDRVEITGKIYGVNGKLLREIVKGELQLELGERRMLSHETDGGQLIEMTLTPGID